MSSKNNKLDDELVNYITLDDCECFSKNKTINPMTGYPLVNPDSTAITSWGNRLKNKCQELKSVSHIQSNITAEECIKRSDERKLIKKDKLLKDLKKNKVKSTSPAGVSPKNTSPAGVSPKNTSPAGVSPKNTSPAGVSARSSASQPAAREKPKSPHSVKNPVNSDLQSAARGKPKSPPSVNSNLQSAAIGKPTTKKIIENDIDKSFTVPFLLCQDWLNNRLKNIFTNRKIDRYDKKYNRFLELCDLFGFLNDRDDYIYTNYEIYNNANVHDYNNRLKLDNKDKEFLKISRQIVSDTTINNLKDFLVLYSSLYKDRYSLNKPNNQLETQANFLINSYNIEIQQLINAININDIKEDDYNKFLEIITTKDNFLSIRLTLNGHSVNGSIFNIFFKYISKHNNSPIINDIKTRYENRVAEIERQLREAIANMQRQNRVNQTERNILRLQLENNMTRDEATNIVTNINDNADFLIKSPIKDDFKEDTIENINGIHNNCLTIFNDIPDLYKKFKNKMITTCDYYKKQDISCTKDKIAAINNKLTYFNRFDTGINDYDNYISISHFINHPAIYSLYITYITFKRDSKFFNTTSDMFFIKNYTFDLDTNEITLEQGQDAGGLFRTFINNIVNELFDDETKGGLSIFIKGSDSEKYFINPNFKIPENLQIFLTFLGAKNFKTTDILRNVDEEKKRKEDVINKETELFYKMIGNLLSFLIINGYNIPKKLSSYILANFLFKNSQIKNTDYLYYMLEDLPSFSSGLIVLLKNPEIIVNATLSYKNESGDEDINVTENNYIDFLYTISKHKCRNNILEAHEKGGNINISNRYDSLTNGIYKGLRNILYNNGVSLLLLEKIMSSKQMDKDILKEFKNSFIINMEEVIDTIQDRNIKTATVNNFKFFKNILSGPREYDDSITDKDEKEEKYYEFLEKLLVYWSGFSNYIETYKYYFIVDINKNVNSLPESHTCIFRLDIPKYDTEEKLYDKLKTAVYNTDPNTYQMAGRKL